MKVKRQITGRFKVNNLPFILQVRVTPNTKVSKVIPDPEHEGHFKIYVNAPAEDGKANRAVIKMLSQALGIRQSSLTITHGLKGRLKTIKVHQ